MAKKKRIYNGKNLIKQFIIEKGIDIGNEYNNLDEFTDKVSSMLNNYKNAMFTQLNMNETDKYVSFFLIDKDDDFEIIDELIKNEKLTMGYDLYYLIFFVNTCDIKIKVEKYLKSNKRKIGKIMGCKSVDLIFDVIQDTKISLTKFIVKIDSRLASINMPLDIRTNISKEYNGVFSKISSYIYTANLYDIVKIYNELGDSLFSQNVRYKIKDVLEVDKCIKETLKNNPEDFWYLNNGITMIIKNKEHININNPNEIDITVKKMNDISVINGAQTISSAFCFFKGEDDSITNKEINNAKNKSKVILRIMYQNSLKDDCKKELDAISVSLNRQKPIVIEDIAYTNKFVFEINQLYEENKEDKYYFYIGKRGEEKRTGYQYDLPKVLRTYQAYNCRPGSARTQSSKTIINDLQQKFDEYEIDETYFKKHFRPMNFSIKLGEKYDKYARSLKSNDLKTIIIKNGKYYFIAFITKLLNNETDFSNFNYTEDNINKDLEDIIILFSEIIESISEKDKSRSESINSNSFKNDEIYNKIDEYKDDEDILEKINRIKATFDSF